MDHLHSYHYLEGSGTHGRMSPNALLPGLSHTAYQGLTRCCCEGTSDTWPSLLLDAPPHVLDTPAPEKWLL